jgi:hypothetical protein
VAYGVNDLELEKRVPRLQSFETRWLRAIELQISPDYEVDTI